MIVDKRGLLKHLDSTRPMELELGCGPHKRHPDAIGVDMLDFPGVDLVGDVFEVLRSLPEESVSAVYAYHFFEHVENLQALMLELERVMRPGGRMIVVTPHFSNPYYYSDYTHKTFFGLYTFTYLIHEDLFKRKTPKYGRVLDFQLDAVDLIFKSPRPFYVRWLFKRIGQAVFNLNYYTREFYEENLTGLFPCYEIRFVLYKRTKSG